MNRYSNAGSRNLAVCAANINSLDERQADLFESRVALLRELASTSSEDISGDASWLDRLKLSYNKALPLKCTPTALSDRCEPNVISSLFNSVSIVEKLEICRTLTKDCTPRQRFITTLLDENGSQTGDAPDPKSLGRVAYMKNNYTESAFLKLSKVISNARSANFQSFEAVCEEVYSGGCEFCILPLETSSEGRLNSFYTMIDRFELKVAAVCHVEHHDSQRFTVFALLKKSIHETDTLKGSPKRQIFEFRLTSSIGGQSPICDILRAAEICGLRLLRLDSLPLPYNDEMLSYYLSFDLDGADLLTFLTYITLEFPECDPLGVYFTVK